MPMAVATMPPSAIGESSTRCSPYLRLQAVGARGTRRRSSRRPRPSRPRDGSRAIMTSMAEFSAWIMFICAMYLSPPRPSSALSLISSASCSRWRRRFSGMSLIHVLEHGCRSSRGPSLSAPKDTASFQAAATCASSSACSVLVLFLAPFAERDQVVLQAFDRIAERPVLVVVLRAVTRRIVAGGMRRGAIGDELDERRAAAGARALRGPLRDRVHREEIVAVDADARQCRSPGRAPRTSAARRRPCPGTWRSPTGC